MMRNIAKLTAAIVLVLAGVLLLLKEFGIFNADIVKFWPAVLVIIGLVMLYEYFSDRRKPDAGIFG